MKDIEFSTKPFWLLHKLAGGEKTKLAADLHKHAIPCSLPTVGKWLSGKSGTLFTTFIDIANAYHIPLRFFIIPSMSEYVNEYCILERAWHEVDIDVKQLVADVFIHYGGIRGDAQKAMDIDAPKRFNNLLNPKHKDLGMTTIQEVVKWMNLVDHDIEKYIIDPNFCTPAPDKMELLSADDYYNGMVAERIEPREDDHGLLREIQKRDVIKRWQEAKHNSTK